MSPQELVNLYKQRNEKYATMYSNSNPIKQPEEALLAEDLLNTDDQEPETQPTPVRAARPAPRSPRVVSVTPTRTSGY
jgi:hypothetical protein